MLIASFSQFDPMRKSATRSAEIAACSKYSKKADRRKRLRPEHIGWAISSGCIRMLNEDVIDLNNRVPIGATVVVI